MAILPLLLAVAGPSAAVGLTPASEVALPDRRIRLGDVADLSGLPAAERRRLESRVIAAVPANRSRIVLTRQALAGLVRRSVPGLALRAGPDEAPLTFRVAATAADRLAGSCAQLARPVEAGAAVSGEDLEPAPCGAGTAAADLRFDRLNRIVRAGGPLAAGTYLGRISATPAPSVDKGDKLSLVATAGPVRVTRDVVAMQPGRAGGRVFVRDSEGNVTSAPLVAGAGE
jgi:flagella basal body P-ring formation protein FlgA